MKELTEDYVLELLSSLDEEKQESVKDGILNESGEPSMIFSALLYQDNQQLIQLSSATGGGLSKVIRQRKNENNNLVKDHLKIKTDKVLDQIR